MIFFVIIPNSVVEGLINLNGNLFSKLGLWSLNKMYASFILNLPHFLLCGFIYIELSTRNI